jgi:hypothetical protein
MSGNVLRKSDERSEEASARRAAAYAARAKGFGETRPAIEGHVR